MPLLDTEATPYLISTLPLSKIGVRAKLTSKGDTEAIEGHMNCKHVVKDVLDFFDFVKRYQNSES